MNLCLLASGMVTGVGLNSPAACAAMRCAITRVVETRFMIRGEWVMGSLVPLDGSPRGVVRLARMVVPAIRECLAAITTKQAQIPLVLIVAEPDRPGRMDDIDDSLWAAIEAEMGAFHPKSAMLPLGKAGIAQALMQARGLIQGGRVPAVLIAGVDTLLTAASINAYFEKGRLLVPDNSDGFIPGEAGTAILVGPDTGSGGLMVQGIGIAIEKATLESGDPLRGEGMANAIRAACKDGGATMDDVDYRITDLNGEQYWFKEAALAIARTIRNVKKEFDLWHPADCIGEIGAAIGPAVLAVAMAAAKKGYAAGPGVLCHFGNDDGTRAALIVRQTSKRGA